MILFSKPYLLISVVGATLFLGACAPTVAPVEQIHKKANHSATSVKKQVDSGSQITQFRCDNDKIVDVEQQKIVKKSTKKETITVTFEGTTYPLSSVVAKEGKKYTNIRWTWHELRNGKGFLYNNTKKTLAANCIKQQ